MKNEVVRGADLLDKQMPGWETRIHVDSLNIASPHLCILGQVYGEYREGVYLLQLNEEKARHYGFNAIDLSDRDFPYDEYNELRDEWLFEIAVRLAASQKKSDEKELVEVC